LPNADRTGRQVGRQIGQQIGRRVEATTEHRRGKDVTVSWTVIVPMKRLDVAKSRLRGALGGVDHDRLVLAMAADTLVAVLACPAVGRVVVVTADPRVADVAEHLGALVITDVPDAGLNPALAYAATMVRPDSAAASVPGVAAVTSDLPALRTHELTEALRLAEQSPRASRTFVADTTGTGTVLLAAPAGQRLEPCFGGRSAAAHTAGGAVALTPDWPSLRRDVDTPSDLAEAIVIGLGQHTSAVCAASTSSPGGRR
jgi:2-phospho-L-lactate/phosphoenolpyruvate guanylyltransferase